jgi:Trk-type K+ transport system membrane component
MGNFSGFSDLGTVLLTFQMWIGRLEILTVIALLHPHTWRSLRWQDPPPAARAGSGPRG